MLDTVFLLRVRCCRGRTAFDAGERSDGVVDDDPDLRFGGSGAFQYYYHAPIPNTVKKEVRVSEWDGTYIGTGC